MGMGVYQPNWQVSLSHGTAKTRKWSHTNRSVTVKDFKTAKTKNVTASQF